MDKSKFIPAGDIIEITNYLSSKGYDTKELKIEQQMDLYAALKKSEGIATPSIGVAWVVGGCIIIYFLTKILNLSFDENSGFYTVIVIGYIALGIYLGKIADYYTKLHIDSRLKDYKIENLQKDK